MEYKIDDVAKLFETTNFTIYSYITKYPDLRKTLKAKSGVLTINEIGVDLLNKYMKDAKGIKDSKSNQPVAEDIFGGQHPDVTVKKKSPEPHIEQTVKPEEEQKHAAKEPPVSVEPSPLCETEPLEKDVDEPEEKSKPYSDFSDFSVRVPPKAPSNDSGFNDVTYREMKEALLYLRDQLDKKDQQINDLSRMLENNQILLKQEQLNFKSLEEYLSKGRY